MTTNFFDSLNQQKNYSEYLRRIDPELVLTHYGAANSFEIRKDDGDIEVQHSCLIDKVIPHHTHGDQNPSARMNLDKKLYVCYSFGGGDIFWLIKTMEGKETFSEILPILGQFLKGSTESKEDFLKELEGYFGTEESEAQSMPTYSPIVLKQWRFIHPYLTRQRGISEEAVKRLQVGYDEKERRIVFPLFFEGKLRGWQKRAVPPSLGYPPTLPDEYNNLPKYKNTSGFPKSHTLFNYDLVKSRKRDKIIVVESPMSCLKAESWTDEQDDFAGVLSTFGAKVSNRQIELLRGFKEVYVYMDSDKPGRKASRQLVEGLWKFTNCFHIEPDGDKDMADYVEKDRVEELIRKAEPAFLSLARWDDVK